ncbi:MAG: hypothetical protein CMO81_00280 [Waddliaceae bacterium]|nr:hypothetical protein [Waddliaceae bacterium]
MKEVVLFFSGENALDLLILEGDHWLGWITPKNYIFMPIDWSYATVVSWGIVIVQMYFWVCGCLLYFHYSQEKRVQDFIDFENSSEAKEHIFRMRNSKNKEMLDVCYGRAVNDLPRWERQISKIYTDLTSTFLIEV